MLDANRHQLSAAWRRAVWELYDASAALRHALQQGPSVGEGYHSIRCYQTRF